MNSATSKHFRHVYSSVVLMLVTIPGLFTPLRVAPIIEVSSVPAIPDSAQFLSRLQSVGFSAILDDGKGGEVRTGDGMHVVPGYQWNKSTGTLNLDGQSLTWAAAPSLDSFVAWLKGANKVPPLPSEKLQFTGYGVPLNSLVNYQRVNFEEAWVDLIATPGVLLVRQGDDSLTPGGKVDSTTDSLLQQIMTLRLQHPALIQGSVQAIPQLDVDDVYGYVRRHRFDVVLVAFNRGLRERDFNVPLAFFGLDTPQILLGPGNATALGGQMKVSLPAHGYIVLGTTPIP